MSGKSAAGMSEVQRVDGQHAERDRDCGRHMAHEHGSEPWLPRCEPDRGAGCRNSERESNGLPDRNRGEESDRKARVRAKRSEVVRNRRQGEGCERDKQRGARPLTCKHAEEKTDTDSGHTEDGVEPQKEQQPQQGAGDRREKPVAVNVRAGIGQERCEEERLHDQLGIRIPGKPDRRDVERKEQSGGERRRSAEQTDADEVDRDHAEHGPEGCDVSRATQPIQPIADRDGHREQMRELTDTHAGVRVPQRETHEPDAVVILPRVSFRIIVAREEQVAGKRGHRRDHRFDDAERSSLCDLRALVEVRPWVLSGHDVLGSRSEPCSADEHEGERQQCRQRHMFLGLETQSRPGSGDENDDQGDVHDQQAIEAVGICRGEREPDGERPAHAQDDGPEDPFFRVEIGASRTIQPGHPIEDHSRQPCDEEQRAELLGDCHSSELGTDAMITGLYRDRSNRAPRVSNRASRGTRSTGLWLALGVGLACLFTAGGSMTSTDAVIAFDVTRSIVERGSIAMTGEVPGYAPYRGVDGQLYSPFGIAQSIWNVPFYVAGRIAAGRVAPGSATGQTIPKAVVALGTVPAVALLALVCFHLAVTLGAAPGAGLRAVLLLVFGTSLWPYSGFGFNQPLAALFLWSAVFFAVDISRNVFWFLAAGLFAGLAILTRHEMLLAGVLIGSYVVIRSWRRDSHLTVFYAAGFLPMLAAWCGLNWWRFGSPFESGYFRDQTPGFGSSIWAGAAGLLFSPYASLILYSPVVLLSVVGFPALWRRDRSAAVLFATLFFGYLMFYASLGNWMGGRSYGPRYLVPLLPALVLPLAFWSPTPRWRPLAGAIALVSVLVQIPGVAVDYSKVRMEYARAGETVAQDMRWSAMPLLLNARVTLRTVTERSGTSRASNSHRTLPPAPTSRRPCRSASTSGGCISLIWA